MVKINFDDNQPIYQQIAEMIEDDILIGVYKEEDQITSTTEFSKILQINPATANKGINLLIDEGILYKKRGLGTFVVPGAREMVLTKRRNAFYKDYILQLLEEAQKIQLKPGDVIEMIKKEQEVNGHEDSIRM